TLPPSLIKAIFMYTAQPLAGSNTFEQGAGEINVEGAIRIARLVRRDLTSVTALGEPLLTASAPVEETTLGGEVFTWSRGIILNQTFASDSELIAKYHKVYEQGLILGVGVVEDSPSDSIDAT